MKPLTGIIGVGSPFGADNVAEQVITLLKQCPLNPAIAIQYYDRPGIYLLDIMATFTTLHLIDAIISDKPSGYIHRYTDLSQLQSSHHLLSCHGIGVAETLALGQTLGCLPETIIVHGIEITATSLTEAPLTLIGSACHKLAQRIAQEVG